MAGSPEPPDDELLSAVRRGDRDALETLIVRYQPRVYRFGLRMCGDPDAASDVLQETLLAMARSLDGFRGDASLSTWLYTVARSYCIKRRRRRKSTPARLESLDTLGTTDRQRLTSPAPGPDQLLETREAQARLDDALAALESSQREVLVLRDIEGLTAPEVGDVLHLSVDAVKSRLHRARVALRRQLMPPLPPDAPPPAPCRDVELMFSRQLEGDLSAASCAEMEAHLATCPSCRQTCEALKETLALCRAAPTRTLPPDVAAAVRVAIRSYLDDRPS